MSNLAQRTRIRKEGSQIDETERWAADTSANSTFKAHHTQSRRVVFFVNKPTLIATSNMIVIRKHHLLPVIVHKDPVRMTVIGKVPLW
jgi:hypothetical protein